MTVRALVDGMEAEARLLAREWARLMAAVGAALRTVASAWASITMVLSFVGGWALITWGLARLLVPEVWLLSGGLFLLVLGGLAPLRDIAKEGLPVILVAKRGRR